MNVRRVKEWGERAELLKEHCYSSSWKRYDKNLLSSKFDCQKMLLSIRGSYICQNNYAHEIMSCESVVGLQSQLAGAWGPCSYNFIVISR